MQACIRCPFSSRDPDNVSGILVLPDSLVRIKESNHLDCTELGPARDTLNAASVAIKSEHLE